MSIREARGTIRLELDGSAAAWDNKEKPTALANPAGPKQEPNFDGSMRARTTRLDALVKELMDAWRQEKSAWPFIERNPLLTDDEVEDVIEKALYLMGHTDDEAKQHAVAVLNLRHDNKNL